MKYECGFCVIILWVQGAFGQVRSVEHISTIIKIKKIGKEVMSQF